MIAFICTAMVAVESFLYSLLQSMGLLGGSYADINNAFPDNTSAQNSILYSIANNPTQNAGGFAPSFASDIDLYSFPAPGSIYNPGSDWAKANWDAIMSALGFYVVGNNVDVAIDNGFNISGNLDTLNIELADGSESIIKYIGYIYADSPSFTSEYLPDYVTYGYPNVSAYLCPVFMTSYHGQILYHTAFHPNGYNASKCYIYINRGGSMPVFSVVNDVPYISWDEYGSGASSAVIGSAWYYYLGWEGVQFESAETLEGVGEEYLSFGDADNPVVSVSYDPATGVTTYTYKDGTTSTTPPAVLGDSIALSPSITQPLTNYIINEGDITNIYNPDAAIPSDSSIPFDFTSLGDLLYKEFTPMLTPDFKPPLNRLLSKYDWETPFKKLAQKFNITGRRPSYPVTFNIFGHFVTWDFWDWCDTLLTTSNYNFYLKFVRFFLYFTMVSGCIALLLRSLHVSIKTVHFGGG